MAIFLDKKQSISQSQSGTLYIIIVKSHKNMQQWFKTALKFLLMLYLPEELIVHDAFLMFSPVISELGNHKIELSNGVSS